MNGIKNNTEKIVIALDGPAASGKSTVAKLLAKKLGFLHLDSGAVYRTLTLAIIQKLQINNFSENFTESLLEKFMQKIETKKISPNNLECTLVLQKGKQINCICNEDVKERIRAPGVTKYIRYIADDLLCREWVNGTLQDFAKKISLVVDGRDIASEVFPQTPFKFFLEASPQTRAERRLKNLQDMKYNLSLEQIKQEIMQRDKEDYSRKRGALKKVPGAVTIQTDAYIPKEILSQILAHLPKDILSKVYQN